MDRETYRARMRQSIKEIDHPDFLGGHFFLTVLGVKDAAPDGKEASVTSVFAN